MLVLSRKLGEKIYIGDNICITLVDIRGDKIRLGIEAPRDVPVYRQEVYETIHTRRTAGEPTPKKDPSVPTFREEQQIHCREVILFDEVGGASLMTIPGGVER